MLFQVLYLSCKTGHVSLAVTAFPMLIFPLEPSVEAIDRKAGDAIQEFKDLVFPDDYNPAGKPAAKRKVQSVFFLFYAEFG